MKLSFSFLYHLRAAPVSVREKSLYMATLIVPCNSIQNLKAEDA